MSLNGPVVMPQRLIFVYNADSGLLPGLKEMFHKILSPATYPCALCAVTFGATAMRPEWKEFVKSLAVPVNFWHRDEFVRAYPKWARHPLPAAFAVAASGELAVFIGAEELAPADLPGLMKMVHARVA
ncbi:MAG: hypothetical protein NVS3B25_12480 [Hymenobacter sp.]